MEGGSWEPPEGHPPAQGSKPRLAGCFWGAEPGHCGGHPGLAGGDGARAERLAERDPE